MRRYDCRGWPLLLSLLLIAGPAVAAPRYTITDLGTLVGGTASFASAINDRGEIVGSSTVGGNDIAFVYREGTMSGLGSAGQTRSTALDINNLGEILLQASTGNSGTYYVEKGNVRRQLPQFLNGGVAWSDLNDVGQVVGNAFPPGMSGRAVILNPGQSTPQDLDTLGGRSANPRMVNNHGQVVGVSQGANNQFHGFVYGGGQMTDIGTLGTGTVSSAFAINDAGAVAAYSTTRGSFFPQRLVLFADGKLSDLGVLPGGESMIAHDMNEQNDIVGYVIFPGFTGKMGAFGYVDGELSYLNDLIDPLLGWQLHMATSINEAGQIVGSGINPAGETRAFRLDPIVEPPPNAVPLPAAVWQGLILGAVSLTGVIRRGARAR
jgi:probable HAF family extracellular repeat protein